MALGEPIDDIEIRAAVGDGLYRAEAPLRPAPAVDDAAFLLDAGRGGENEHFGRDPSRIGARPLPEARRLVLEQIGDHHPLELIQSRADQTRVGAAHRGVLAEAEESLHLAGEHGVSEREKGVALSLKSAGRAWAGTRSRNHSRSLACSPHHAFSRLTTYFGVFCSQFALAGLAATGVTRFK